MSQVIGCSPAGPIPAARVGYLVEGPPGPCSRLRAVCSRASRAGEWPRIDAICPPLPPRPLGDVVPWVWALGSAPPRAPPSRPLAAAGGRHAAERDRRAARDGGHVPIRRSRSGVLRGEDFEKGGFTITPRRVPTTTSGLRLRVSAQRRRCVLGRQRAERRARGVARDADLFLCEATLLEPKRRADSRAPRCRRGQRSVSGLRGKRLLLTHRPKERRSSSVRAGPRRVRDGV